MVKKHLGNTTRPHDMIAYVQIRVTMRHVLKELHCNEDNTESDADHIISKARWPVRFPSSDNELNFWLVDNLLF